MPHNLYYIDSIYRREGRDNTDGYITLISTDADENGKYLPTTIPFNRIPVVRKVNDTIEVSENNYVFLRNYNYGDELVFEDGNNSQYSEAQFMRMSDIRQRLHDRYGNVTEELTEKEFLILSHPTEIYSYHVNVGHGNCSLILIKSGYQYLLWMVDCSVVEATYTFGSFRDHSANIEDCLNEIARKAYVKVDSLYVSRFFLTHPHYDHYNGVAYLRKKGLLNGNTTYYINYYFDSSCESFMNILEELYNENVKIVEPVSYKTEMRFLKILHPKCRIYRSGKLIETDELAIAYRPVGNANNASVVYDFSISQRSIVFPGDLQHEGFDAMTNENVCCNMFEAPDYYAISHHGSSNGHPQQRCLTHHIPFYPLGCFTKNVKKAVLMGRDGAYSGIFDSKVVSFFDQKDVLVSTDMRRGRGDLKYLSLNWLDGSVEYKF